MRLKAADLVLEDEIRRELHFSGRKEDVTFTQDSTLELGGCVIVDASGGRIFDSSLERICFRKSSEIRRQVTGLMEKSDEIGRENK